MKKTYSVTIQTTYIQDWEHEVEAETEDEAITEASELCEFDWSYAEVENKVLDVHIVK